MVKGWKVAPRAKSEFLVVRGRVAAEALVPLYRALDYVRAGGPRAVVVEMVDEAPVVAL